MRNRNINEATFAEIKQMVDLKNKNGIRVLNNARISEITGYARSTISRVTRFETLAEYKKYVKETIGFHRQKKTAQSQGASPLESSGLRSPLKSSGLTEEVASVDISNLKITLEQNTELLTAFRSVVIEAFNELKNNDQVILKKLEQIEGKTARRFGLKGLI